MGCLGVRTDDGRSFVDYGCILGSDSCGFGECLAVASNVSSLRPNKADEVVDSSHFVLRYLK